MSIERVTKELCEAYDRYNYRMGWLPPHYPVPAIAYDFTDVINGECVMLTYRNRSDVKAPWRVAYEYPYPVPAIIYEYGYDYPEAMYLDQVVVADEYGNTAITIKVWWYQ